MAVETGACEAAQGVADVVPAVIHRASAGIRRERSSDCHEDFRKERRAVARDFLLVPLLAQALDF